MENYSGSIRIKRPDTLQRWIDKGWFSEQLKDGYQFCVGCGRFRKDKCECTLCRKKKRPELVKIIEQFNSK